MAFDYIIFDLDGTLTDSEEGITKSVQYALESFGIKEDDKAMLHRFIGPSLVTAFNEFYGFDAVKAKAATLKYRERYSKFGIYENKLYNGVITLLKDLKKQNKVIALGTSKPLPYAKKILEYFDIYKYFDVICGTEFEGIMLEKKDIINLVIKKLGLVESKYSKIVMVGDRKYDIIGANAVGIASIGVEYGFAEEDELKANGADYVVKTVGQLKELLLTT